MGAHQRDSVHISGAPYNTSRGQEQVREILGVHRLRSLVFFLHRRLLNLDIPRCILGDKKPKQNKNKMLGPPEKNGHLHKVTHINRAYSIRARD